MKKYAYQLYVLTAPILITQLALQSNNLLDTIMTGRYDSQELAGIAIATSLWMPILMITFGIIMAVTPFVANYYGAKNTTEIPQIVHQAFYLTGMICVVVIILLNNAGFVIDWMKIEEDIRPVVAGYLHALSFGVPALLGYNVLKAYSDGIGITRPAMFTGILSLPVNAIMNYILIFGHFGFPALGGIGAGWATTITYYAMFLTMFLFTIRMRHYLPYHLYQSWNRFSYAKIWEIIKLGLPIGITLFVEGSIFAIITLLMNSFGSEVVAAHQIAINFASMTFMVPLSLAIGLTIVVGQSIGAKEVDDALKFVKVGLISAGGFMTMSAAVMILFAEQIVALYTKDLHVQSLAAGFLLFAALFQISDGINVSSQGALRGFKDTTISLIFNVIAYWVISLPLGYILAHTDWIIPALGAKAFWISIIIGLSFSAVASVIRLAVLLRRARSTESIPIEA